MALLLSVEVSKPLVANSLNGQHIGRITRTTIPMTLWISGNHQERLSQLIIDSPHSPVVLGHPWMAKPHPRVDWAKHEILCSTRCLRKAHSPAAVPQDEEVLNFEKLPAEYLDLREVFCKSSPFKDSWDSQISTKGSSGITAPSPHHSHASHPARSGSIGSRRSKKRLGVSRDSPRLPS